MYHEFFGLTEPAFSIAVNPRYLFMSEQHREALAHLLFGIQRGGFVMLTGEVGTGKTTIIRCLLEQLPINTDIAIILNPMASAPELLSTICDELGASYLKDEPTIKELTDSLNRFLLENHRKGRKTVLLIDEAQLLKVPVLEQIRLLTNLETTTEKLLQIVLVGQPELKKLLAKPSLRQLSQRITARFHLEALSSTETKDYIAHRLKVAGLAANQQPFTDEMIKKIHRFSGGIPRLINVLCERLLLGAYAKNRRFVDKDIFDKAVKEVGEVSKHEKEDQHEYEGTKKALGWQPLVAAFLIGGIIAVWAFVPTNHTEQNILASGSVSTLITSTPAQSVVTQNTNAASSSSAATDTDFLSLAQRDKSQAQIDLFNFLGITPNDKNNPCINKKKVNYVCEKTQLHSWDELKDINRPGIMTLATPEKKWVYAVVIGLNENHLVLFDAKAEKEQQQKIVLWTDIVERWNGDLIYVWSRPKDFEDRLELGDKSPLVTWVAEQFAKLDKQSSPLTREFFTDKLKKRVELFQASHNIIPDGVFNAQTLRRLNEDLAIDKTLMTIDDAKLAATPSKTSGGL
jgi:general secretion pathway protein A